MGRLRERAIGDGLTAVPFQRAPFRSLISQFRVNSEGGAVRVDKAERALSEGIPPRASPASSGAHRRQPGSSSASAYLSAKDLRRYAPPSDVAEVQEKDLSGAAAARCSMPAQVEDRAGASASRSDRFGCGYQAG